MPKMFLRKAVSNKTAYFKKKLLQTVNEYEQGLHEELRKAQSYPIGTIREWRGQKYIKTPSGKWTRKYDQEARGTKLSLMALKKQIDACTLPEQLMRLVLEQRDRFIDAQGQPLPIVQELSRHIQGKNSGAAKQAKRNKRGSTPKKGASKRSGKGKPNDPPGKTSGSIPFSELKKYVEENLGVPFDEGLQDFDTGAMLESVKGVEDVLSDFPEVKGYLTGFGKTDKDDRYMDCGFEGKIYFSSVFTSRFDIDSALNKDVATKVFQSNMGIDDLGKHEALHLCERALIYRNKAYKTEEERIGAWNGCKESKDIVDDAFELTNRQLKGKYASLEDMAREISYNAIENPSECLVEAVLDYYYHKEKSRLFSKIVYDIVQRRLK